MRVLLDTNVLISLLLSPRSRTIEQLHKTWETSQFNVVSTLEFFKELNDVLQRPRIGRLLYSHEEVSILLERLQKAVEIGGSAPGSPQAYPDLRDPRDAKVLSAGEKLQPDVLVTGDEDLLELREFQGIPILSPRQFLDRIFS